MLVLALCLLVHSSRLLCDLLLLAVCWFVAYFVVCLSVACCLPVAGLSFLYVCCLVFACLLFACCFLAASCASLVVCLLVAL